jgi:hypothetical protein
MTPKEKAKKLVNKYLDNIPFADNSIERAKQCALISVEEIRFFHESLFYATEGSLFDDYLNKVQNEINQL